MRRSRKIIFFDIDGTLCAFGGQVPESTRNALERLKENGHIPVVCTGRPRCTVFSEITELGFSGIVAGAGTYLEYQGQVLRDRRLTGEELRRGMEFLSRMKIPMLLEGTRYLYYDQTRETSTEEFPILLRMQQEAPEKLKPLDWEADAGKITVYVKGQEHFLSACRELEDIYTLIHYEKGVHAELVPKGMSKARGIEALISYLGIKREDTIAFGDGPNDLEMLQYVRYGVAMGNGEDHVVRTARYRTERIEQDGIQLALERFGLI